MRVIGSLAACAAAWLAVAFHDVFAAAPPGAGPNVVMIAVDDLRPDDARAIRLASLRAGPG